MFMNTFLFSIKFYFENEFNKYIKNIEILYSINEEVAKKSQNFTS